MIDVELEKIYLQTFEGLLRRIKRYNQAADLDLLHRAFHFAFAAHRDQLRKSGTPYFEHPLEVVKILTGLKMDWETIAGGLLHDVVEDTNITIDQVEKEFGSNISQLVNGVTKISELKLLEFEEQQSENFRKMWLSMVKDIRVILIKFADRLHNMRTLEYLPEKSRRRVAAETKEVYAPLAHRLGLAKIKCELEDLALKALEPETFAEIDKRVQETRAVRESIIQLVTRPIRKALVEARIRARFEGRAKHYYSIYNKINKRQVPFDQIYDLLAIRIVVDTVEECYHALGIVHALFTPIHERFKDYIATPKSNGYQSVHTTVFTQEGRKVEIQIRTEEMHRMAEDGIAAHWRYKEGKLREDDLDQQLTWIRSVLDSEYEEIDNQSFLDHVKVNLFQDEVFVYTPKGDLYKLPMNSTPVDFAFAVHTDIGLHCLAAKVSGRIVPLSHILKSGDMVEIITSANQKPNEDWLKFVITSRARSRIKKFLRDSQQESSVALGEEMLTKALHRYAIKMKDVNLLDIANRLNFREETQLFAAIGRGDIKLEMVVRKIVPEEKSESRPLSTLSRIIGIGARPTQGVRVAGMDNIMISFGKCCNPVPGEPITGIVTRGRGIVIHANSCKNLLHLMQEQDRIIDVTWDVEKGHRFRTGLHILAERSNKILSDLTDAVTSVDSNIASANMESDGSLSTCILIIEVHDLNHLNRVIAKIRKMTGVLAVDRLNE